MPKREKKRWIGRLRHLVSPRCGGDGSCGVGDQPEHGGHRRKHGIQNERRMDVRVSGIIERAKGEGENGEENFQSLVLPDRVYWSHETAGRKRVYSKRVENNRERSQRIHGRWETVDCDLRKSRGGTVRRVRV